MNDRSFAISILQKARDALHARLTERIIESEHEIAADAEGGSYLSEIETIYDQLGSRLAHLNAMLSNLPALESPAPADATASEIIYADLASAYPTGLDLESAPPVPLLGLPAPGVVEQPQTQSPAAMLQNIIVQALANDLAQASRLIGELFDIKPSHARRGAQALARQIVKHPDLARRIEELGVSLDTANEYLAATLLGEWFEFQAIDALSCVRTLRSRPADTDTLR